MLKRCRSIIAIVVSPSRSAMAMTLASVIGRCCRTPPKGTKASATGSSDAKSRLSVLEIGRWRGTLRVTARLSAGSGITSGLHRLSDTCRWPRGDGCECRRSGTAFRSCSSTVDPSPERAGPPWRLLSEVSGVCWSIAPASGCPIQSWAGRCETLAASRPTPIGCSLSCSTPSNSTPQRSERPPTAASSRSAGRPRLPSGSPESSSTAG